MLLIFYRDCIRKYNETDFAISEFVIYTKLPGGYLDKCKNSILNFMNLFVPNKSSKIYEPPHQETKHLHNYVKTKDADQLCSNCTADKRLSFCYSDDTIPVVCCCCCCCCCFLKSEQASKYFLWQYSQI